jgi:hypothetical protein
VRLARCLLDANRSPLWARGKGKGARRADAGLRRPGRLFLLRRWPPGDASARGAYHEWPRGLAREIMPAAAGAAAGGGARKAPLRGAALVAWVEERSLRSALNGSKPRRLLPGAPHGAHH